MKLFIIFTTILVFALMTDICSAVHLAVKRNDPTGQPIANAFAKIADTIRKLDEAQMKAGQNGTVDFGPAAELLAQLSIDAECAEDKLNSMGNQQLDQVSAKNVKISLIHSANHVHSITNMIEQGKDWFDKNQVTSIVVYILQSNVYMLTKLFLNLNNHSPPDRFPKYYLYESNIICSQVLAIKDLDKTQVSKEDLEKCYSGDYFSSSSPSNTICPPGFQSCQNSPATYYQTAYSQKTMGTSNTVCTSNQKVSASNYVVPSDPLMMKSNN